MKRNVSELIGSELDYAVAAALYTDGRAIDTDGGVVVVHTSPQSGVYVRFYPSTNWSQGGPIIERENIFLIPPHHTTEVWDAYTIEWGSDLPCWGNIGPTPLIAAMRCFVESRLGEEIDIPDNLEKE